VRVAGLRFAVRWNRGDVKESQKFCLVTPNWGRSITDTGWESIEAQHIQLWKDATTQLASRNVNTGDGLYTIKADWSQILRGHERPYAALKYFYLKNKD
jgi:hypothetical protein